MRRIDLHKQDHSVTTSPVLRPNPTARAAEGASSKRPIVGRPAMSARSGESRFGYEPDEGCFGPARRPKQTSLRGGIGRYAQLEPCPDASSGVRGNAHYAAAGPRSAATMK